MCLVLPFFLALVPCLFNKYTWNGHKKNGVEFCAGVLSYIYTFMTKIESYPHWIKLFMNGYTVRCARLNWAKFQLASMQKMTSFSYSLHLCGHNGMLEVTIG